MPTYRYTGDEPRIPAPPILGDLIPGETVHSAEPVDHPDLEPVDEETRAATEQLREAAAKFAAQQAAYEAAAEQAPVAEMHSTADEVVEDTPRPRARARAKE
jgi:hypothetical protein